MRSKWNRARGEGVRWWLHVSCSDLRRSLGGWWRQEGFFVIVLEGDAWLRSRRTRRSGEAGLGSGMESGTTAEGISQGLRCASVAGYIAKAEALSYLEAKACARMKDRRASFTESESGKVSSRSGAIRRTLVPGWMRARCLPRTPLLKSRFDRSARGSSSGDLFILALLGRCDAGTDDLDVLNRLRRGQIPENLFWDRRWHWLLARQYASGGGAGRRNERCPRWRGKHGERGLQTLSRENTA